MSLFKAFTVNKPKFEISYEDFEAVREELSKLRQENKELKMRCNYEHLVQDNYMKSDIIESMSKRVKSLESELQREKATCSAVTQKLKEVIDICDSYSNRDQTKITLTREDFKVYA